MLNKKSRSGRNLIFIIIGILYAANYVIWPLLLYNNSSTANLRYAQFRYISLALSYLFLAFCISIERENLENFHLDKASLVVFACTSIPFLRPVLNIPGEIFALISILASGIIVLLTIRQCWSKIPGTNISWILIGIIITCIVLVPANYIDYLVDYSVKNKPPDGLNRVTHDLLYNLFFVSVTEEMIFRGFFWGYLRLMGWSEKKAFAIQFVIFWMGHASQNIMSPLIFFVSTPIITLVLGFLVYRSKQIFPAIISHTLYNVFFSFWRFLIL